MTTIDQIKTLLQSGDVAGAEALCRKALETHPDDAQLKMLFGLCRQLQGDELVRQPRKRHVARPPRMTRAARRRRKNRAAMRRRKELDGIPKKQP